jgi:hypothetical protein
MPGLSLKSRKNERGLSRSGQVRLMRDVSNRLHLMRLAEIAENVGSCARPDRKLKPLLKTAKPRHRCRGSVSRLARSFCPAITSHPDRHTGDRDTAGSDRDKPASCKAANEPAPALARYGRGRNCMRRCDPRSPHRSHRRQHHGARASPRGSVRMPRAGRRQQPTRLEGFSWSCLSLIA